MHLTTTQEWVYIFLFGFIVWKYSVYLFKTIRFFKKESTKDTLYKWKYPYPLKNLFNLQETKNIYIWLLVMVGLGILMELRGNILEAILSIGYLFFVTRLHREFHIHVFVTREKIYTWSVFREKKEENVLLNGEISEKDFQKAEWENDGFIVHTADGRRKVFLNHRQKRELENHFQNK